jgi:hypothetical protein
MTMSTKNLVLRTVYISPETDDKLRAEAFDRRTSKNDLIRRYIELGMQAAEQSATRDGASARRKSSARKAAGASVARKK